MRQSVVRDRRGERKCWGHEVADTLVKEGCKAVVVVPIQRTTDTRPCVTVMTLSRAVLLLGWMSSIEC